MSVPVTLPPPVRPGCRIGVAALSGPVSGTDLELGLERLRALGFEPVTAANLSSKQGFFAGSDEERLQGFHDLIADPSIAAIVFARGGHGVLRVLPRLDWGLIDSRPMAYVGYSDLTPFLLEVVRRTGVATFHGPMLARELAHGLSDEESASLLGALSGRFPAVVPIEPIGDRRQGAEGPLIGGCLSLLTATLGTPFASDLGGCILFWEDIDEPLYRLDRMLIQLRLSGRLNRLAAMVVGKVQPTDKEGQDGLSELLRGVAAGAEWPVAAGCASGHCRPNLTLPLGLKARLSLDRGELLVGLPS